MVYCFRNDGRCHRFHQFAGLPFLPGSDGGAQLAGGFGSLVGALAMWAVGNVSESIGGFTIPMIAVTVAIVLAAAAGWAATRQAAITRPTALSNQEA